MQGRAFLPKDSTMNFNAISSPPFAHLKLGILSVRIVNYFSVGFYMELYAETPAQFITNLCIRSLYQITFFVKSEKNFLWFDFLHIFGRGFSRLGERLHLKNFIWHRSNKCLRNIENIVTCAFHCSGTRTEISRETDFKFLAKEGLFAQRKVSKYIYLPSLNPSAEQITSFKLFFSNYT